MLALDKHQKILAVTSLSKLWLNGQRSNFTKCKLNMRLCSDLFTDLVAFLVVFTCQVVICYEWILEFLIYDLIWVDFLFCVHEHVGFIGKWIDLQHVIHSWLIYIQLMKFCILSGNMRNPIITISNIEFCYETFFAIMIILINFTFDNSQTSPLIKEELHLRPKLSMFCALSF